jgi:hypothetical protein
MWGEVRGGPAEVSELLGPGGRAAHMGLRRGRGAGVTGSGRRTVTVSPLLLDQVSPFCFKLTLGKSAVARGITRGSPRLLVTVILFPALQLFGRRMTIAYRLRPGDSVEEALRTLMFGFSMIFFASIQVNYQTLEIH